MTQELQLFKNNKLGQVRLIEDSDNPLFCLNDISKALGTQIVAC